ncbi:MAG: Pseudouridine synthase [Candidatus Curtissbacteria bacterium GW2011_GWA1_40_9]|uniref:Pseudouridine synthase n=1 Tax=Candidatus Curtissbacteria bacterium GW2011_GWA1_40_9 TaxID=1618408 RepID=A0A0G0WS76_9BACT|nr:MAG: Pseudouridine synthase [Candidatus Curtissbacteria bacterium GW2011_GWA1_40_9]
MKQFDIVFENKHLLVVVKPAGLVVNRSQTINEETLQDQISRYLKLSRGNLGVGERAGIVHRLDRETSGLIVVAKTQSAFENLQSQFKNREVEKEYGALVHGVIPNDGVIRENIGRVGKFGRFGVVGDGRESVTAYKKAGEYSFSEDKFDDLVAESKLNKGRVRYLQKNARIYSRVSLFPKTGRTHQIRVHLKHIGHLVVSDIIYAPSKLLKFDMLWCSRLFLHAAAISFRDPKSRKILSFKADLPNELKSAMLNLEKV